ncbi:PAS domain-containing sensor histidine kinase [Carboxylicivirga sp. M1479]|uniref:sensor histidine kinase n=1 Tax=Carboxylicivirga sp. M1479 TaxID=2594476 RepID=UPI0011782955|nr:ATP-binding protein [Carboxylicivirga sp. M1479]TRX72385.1 PAS domain S-box protein [Carboxylicivirga sp. M1479]
MNKEKESIQTLEFRIKELEKENNSLSNKVEEMLLLSLINESFETIKDEQQLLLSVLEKISILKEIPYCACYAIDGNSYSCIAQYCSLFNSEPCQGILFFSDGLLRSFTSEAIIRFTIKEHPEALQLITQDDRFEPAELLAIPFHTRTLKNGVFIFMSSAKLSIPFPSDLQSFHQVIQIVIDKWDRLSLIDELQLLTHQLEERVEERTSLLQQSEEKYRQLFNMANDAIYLWSLNDKDEVVGCVEMNDAVQKLTGYTQSELQGVNPLSLLDDNYTEEEKYTFEKQFKAPNSVFRASFKAKTDLLPLEVHTRRFKFMDQDLVIAIARDISEQLNTEKRMLEARNKAVESERLKSAFLANMSHEIRTPMNAIVGFSELLSQDIMTATEVHMYAKIIFKNSMHLLNLINDIVDYSKIEAEQVKIVHHPININELISDLSINMISLLRSASKSHIDVLTHTPLGGDKAIIQSDGTRLRQVLSNLINNAIKFTQQGFIEVGYSLKGNDLEFFVHDTGIGIAPEYQDKIFERFVQVRNEGVQNQGGTGLGLAICANLIEKMQGNMCLESSSGEGSKFIFTIPYHLSKHCNS